jgi:hypothetical protein
MKTQLKQYKGLQEVVKTFLEKREDLRDSDPKLIANVWRKEIETLAQKEGALEDMSALVFLAYYLVPEKISSSDSITRARRKIQQDNEHLRGNNYKERQAQEKEFRKQANC